MTQMPTLADLIDAAQTVSRTLISPQGARAILGREAHLWGITLFDEKLKPVRREPRGGDVLVASALLDGSFVGTFGVYEVVAN